jgi:hypothetical protein
MDFLFPTTVLCGIKISIIAVYVVVIMFIIIYWPLAHYGYIDHVMETEVCNYTILQHIDLWGISHACMFNIIGLLFPNRHLMALTVGAGWEMIECWLGANIPKMDKNDYWYGKESDIVVDMAGYTLGSAFSSYLGHS